MVPGRTRSALGALALGAALGACGCATDRLDYFPRQVVPEESKLEQAALRLEETAARAATPRIALVTAGEHELHIKTHPYGRRGRRVARRYVIPYHRIKWIKLFDEAEVRVGDHRDQTMLRLRFHTDEDAAQFADLLHSLRYWAPIAGRPPPPSVFGFDEGARASEAERERERESGRDPRASTSSPPARRP